MSIFNKITNKEKNNSLRIQIKEYNVSYDINDANRNVLLVSDTNIKINNIEIKDKVLDKIKK